MGLILSSGESFGIEKGALEREADELSDASEDM